MKRIFAVIGDPIAHSRSPELYAPMFEKNRIDADFLRIRVSREELPNSRQIAVARRLDGFAVTMPHKRAIIPYLDAVDENAAAAGSVNIVTETILLCSFVYFCHQILCYAMAVTLHNFYYFINHLAVFHQTLMPFTAPCAVMYMIL